MINLEVFLNKNGLKKKWLAKALNIAPEHLRYYFRKNESLPADLNDAALLFLKKLSTNIDKFLITEIKNK